MCRMSKKILTALLLSLFVTCFSGFAYGSDEAIDECNNQLKQKYPNVEAIKQHFGDWAEWQEKTRPSIHDEAEYNFITFTFENNQVTEMKFEADLD